MTDLIDVSTSIDVELAQKYLDTLYPTGFGGGWGVIFTLPSKRSFTAKDPDGLLQHLTSDLLAEEVYFGMGIHAVRPQQGSRGTSNTVAALPGFFVDVDIAGPGHKEEGLAPNRGMAMEVIRTFPLPPTMIVNTGGGLQAYWCLHKPMIVHDDNRNEVKQLLVRFIATVDECTSYKVDPTNDLARVLRVPGTLNNKAERPRPVKIVECFPNRRYSLDDLRPHLAPERRDNPNSEPRTTSSPEEGRPGDDFNERKSFPELLEEHGWYRTGVSGSVETWARPNANTGKSATYNYDDSGKLFIFSSSVPGLEPGRFYDQFQFYAYTVHNGDFIAAARQLRREGYGSDESFREDPQDGTLVPTFERCHREQENEDGSSTWKFDPHGSAEALIELYNAHTVRQSSKTFYIYQDGRYTIDHGNYQLHRAMTMALGSYFHTSKVANTFSALRGLAPLIDPTERPSLEYLNVNNGLLHWQTGELQPHTPDIVSMTRIPVTWNPNATCPAVDAFFERNLEDPEVISFVWEVIGYMLWPDTKWEKAIMAYGKGGTGKSGFLELVEALVGVENRSTVALQELTRRFQMQQVLGKLVNISTDISNEAVTGDTGVFKQLVSGESITIELKGKDSFSARPYVKLLFSANEYPASADSTSGWRRRWLVIPFERQWTGKEADYNANYKKEITTRREIEGALVKAVEGLRRLASYQTWNTPKHIHDATMKMFSEIIPARRFADEVLQPHEGSELSKNDVYMLYREWCKQSGNRPKQARRFRDDLHEYFAEDTKYSEMTEEWKKYMNLGVVPDWYSTLMRLRGEGN